MFKDVADLKRYLEANASERRDLEYKRGGSWESLRYKIARAALAMSNLEGGGRIIVGVQEDGNDGYDLAGMTQDHARTYKKDDISDFVNKYADPHAQVDVCGFCDGSKHFVVIDVLEFEETPVICKKDHKKDMRRGRIYARPHRKNESTPDLTAHEMKEIVENAVDKGIRKQLKRIKSYAQDSGADPFAEERGTF